MTARNILYFKGFLFWDTNIAEANRAFPYVLFLTIKFITNKITIAPIAPVKIEAIHPSPREILNTDPKSQYPTPLPRRPTMIFPISPNPLPL